MSTEDPFAFVAAGQVGEQKPAPKKPHWREKLFSKEKRSKGSTDQQIEAFLGPTRSKSVTYGGNLNSPPRPEAGHRWPSTQDVLKVASKPPVDFTKPPFKSRRKGMKVKFSNRTPDVIGEGGDELETPTIEISLRRDRARSQGSDEREDLTDAQPKLPQLHLDTSFGDNKGHTSRGSRQQSSPQKGLNAEDWKPLLLQNAQDADFLMTLNFGDRGSRLSFRASPESHSFAQRVRDKMQAEEGRALQHRLEPHSPVSPADDIDVHTSAEKVPDSPSSMYETPPISETESSPPENPFRGPPQPQIRRSPEPETPVIPSVLSPGGYSQSFSPPKSLPIISGPQGDSPGRPRSRDNRDTSRSPSVLSPGGNSPALSPPKSVPITSGSRPDGPSRLSSRDNRDASRSPSVPSSSGNSQSFSPPKSLPVIGGPQADGPSGPSGRDGRDTSRSPKPPQAPKISLRSVANQIGDTAFADLKVYLAQFKGQIQMSAEGANAMEISISEWMRAALWWFLRGKKRLEAYARSRPSSSGGRSPQQSSTQNAKQAIVDLGKALWINEQVILKHDEVTRYGAMGTEAVLAVASTTGNTQLADLLGLHQTMMNLLRSLAMSIKRNNILVAISSNGDSSIPVDTSVWVRYPPFAADVAAVLSGAATRSLFADKSGKGPTFVQMMPLSDTNRFFSYGSMFVEVHISSPEDETEQIPIPCALSIIRDRTDWYVFAAISSQSELVNVVIQSDKKKGPTWESVDWQVRTHSMRVKLPRGFELDVMFQEDDFKNIWNIVQYTRKTEAGLQPESGEAVVYETTLKSFHYMDPSNSKAFPADPVDRCSLRLFERSKPLAEGHGTRSLHYGFRLAVLTSPSVKTVSSVRHILGHGTPIVFGLLRGEDGAPALLLKVKEEGKPRSMLMTFHEPEERSAIHSLLLGIMPKSREVKSPEIPIRAYTIEQPADRANGTPAKEHLQFPAGTVSIIDQEHARVDHGYGQTVLSEYLRAFIATEWGSVTDRINLGPGDLKLGLEVNNRTGLSLYRPGQKDLTVSVAENLVPPEMPDKLSEFLQTTMVKPMIRRFDFATVQDLHMFQRAVTGFKVLFDSVASSFSISRRRMVVPITKKWESSLARIQVIRRERVVQLVAFLNDFHHGRCLNFVLKGTDTLESFGKAGKFGVRIVDAKFALPKTDDDPSSQFVSLDTPEYPMEHDDISIAFDSEADRTKFQASVPGSIREPSRMSSLRR